MSDSDTPEADKLDAVLALLAEGDREGAAAVAGIDDDDSIEMSGEEFLSMLADEAEEEGEQFAGAGPDREGEKVSMFVSFDDSPPSQVASTTGWYSFGRWVDGLEGSYPDLEHLREFGWTEPAEVLAKELAAALAEQAPEDPDTLDVANGLLELLKGETDAVVGISNGVETDEDEETNEELDDPKAKAGTAQPAG